MTGTMNFIVLLLFFLSLGGFILGRIMKWKKVWLVSLIFFGIMVIAVFIVWYFFPQVWFSVIRQIKEAY